MMKFPCFAKMIGITLISMIVVSFVQLVQLQLLRQEVQSCVIQADEISWQRTEILIAAGMEQL